MLRGAPDAISASALRASAPTAPGPDQVSYLSTRHRVAGHTIALDEVPVVAAD